MAAQQSQPPADSSSASRRVRVALGTLEAGIMEALWGSSSELSVQDVRDALGPGHNYKTVMTVLNRLVEKGLLSRQLDGRAYRYRPRQTRTEFLRSAADELVRGYLEAFGDDAAEHLAGAAGAAAPGPEPAREKTWGPLPYVPTGLIQRRPQLVRLLLIAVVLAFLLTRRRRERP
ncbi:MAG: BlaI/MecI/CopY family transcriptional regulator [Chloroflexi bacterium]|nr:BlaI/MecI/CopY family transcriptional regulator [Chloroflexota bacterium]